MTTTVNYSAFPEASRLARVEEATGNGAVVRCGWIPPDDRTRDQEKATARILAEMPRFTIRGRFTAAERRYPLWKAHKDLTGRHHRYNWQQTGSCVGAAGGSMAKTAISVEIALKGEAEEYRDLWWPYTYGRSRLLGGLRGQGEGSFGSSWAKAATADGFFEIDPEGLPDLPDFKDQGGWLVQPAAVEMKWSDGAKIGPEWLAAGRKHLFKTAAPMRSAGDCFEALANGYPLTLASMFGMRNMVPAVRGTRFPVRVGEWTGEWAHQMFCDEAWDHPEVSGLLFRIGNNWGPDAHGRPTGDEPPGGFYVTGATMDRICRAGEVYAFSSFDGFPARELNYGAF